MADVIDAIYFRVHLGHRENATELAINLIRKAARLEKQESEGDPFSEEACEIGERWAIGHVIGGCYIEEYHHWEKGIKQYFSGQYRRNGLTGDFNWRAGGKSMVELARTALSEFSASVEEHVFQEIDAIRDKVNAMKHDPLEHSVEEADYFASIKTFERFWDALMEIERQSIG